MKNKLSYLMLHFVVGVLFVQPVSNEVFALLRSRALNLKAKVLK